MMYGPPVKNATFVGARRHFEKYNCKKLWEMFPPLRGGGNRGKRKEEYKQEIKMCPVQLYLIFAARKTFIFVAR